MSDDIKLNWWAQELLRLRRQSQEAAGTDIRYLGQQDNLAGFKKIAATLMSGVLTPAEVWRDIIGPAGASPIHEIRKIAGTAATRRTLNGVGLTPIERVEMEALHLNPEILEQVVEYRLRDRLKRIAENFDRRLGTRDFGSKKVLEEIAFNFDNFPAWLCYILGAGNQEVYDQFGLEGIRWLRENPIYGDALVRIGFPVEIIYPLGHPHE